VPLSIFERDGKIAVSSPYDPKFPPRARELGGTWDRGRLIWLFDPQHEERVRALCAEVYGPGLAEAAPAGPHYHGHRRRLRERVIEAGAEALPDYELLEALLFAHDPRRDTKPLAKALIEKFGGFPEVLEADREALFDAGVSLAGATALKLTREAAIRLARAQLRSGPVLGTSDALLDYCVANIAHSKVEEFHILFLDRKNVLIKHERQGKGTVDHTPVYIREVIKRTLELGASAIILVHNHPSGDPTPSGNDFAVTAQIVQAAKAIGIAVHDHLIIGRGAHISLRDIGFLETSAVPAAARSEPPSVERRRGAGRPRSSGRRGDGGRVREAAEDP
jgi:DNA repair protein RadC